VLEDSLLVDRALMMMMSDGVSGGVARESSE
jgi:hypothetical protein